MRSRFVVVIFGLFLCLSLAWVILVSPVQSQEIAPDPPLSGEPEPSGHLAAARSSPTLIASATYTKTIEAAVLFSEYRFFSQMLITDMPSGTFTWIMHNNDPNTVSDLYFDSVGGDGCTQESDMDIVCEDITSFYLEYRYTNVYWLDFDTKRTGAGASFTGFSLNHFVTLRYIEPWVYLESFRSGTMEPIAPIGHENETLEWQILDSSAGGITSVFLDTRIDAVGLPVVIKK